MVVSEERGSNTGWAPQEKEAVAGQVVVVELGGLPERTEVPHQLPGLVA